MPEKAHVRAEVRENVRAHVVDAGDHLIVAAQLEGVRGTLDVRADHGVLEILDGGVPAATVALPTPVLAERPAFVRDVDRITVTLPKSHREGAGP